MAVPFPDKGLFYKQKGDANCNVPDGGRAVGFTKTAEGNLGAGWGTCPRGFRNRREVMPVI
jgi:hypothetical protein